MAKKIFAIKMNTIILSGGYLFMYVLRIFLTLTTGYISQQDRTAEERMLTYSSFGLFK